MKKLKVKAIEVLQNHAQKRQKTRAKLATHLRLKQKQLIQNCFVELFNNKNYQVFKRSYKPFLRRR